MKRLYFLMLLILISCNKNEEYFTLSFKDVSAHTVKDSLVKFNRLFEKTEKTEYVYNSSEENIEDVHSNRREIYYSQNLTINFKDRGLWETIKNDEDVLYNFYEFRKLTKNEKKQFWLLFKFLINNEINGANQYENLLFFPFRQYPFSDRFSMYIVLEEDFNNLNEKEHELWLQNNLIIDKKDGMLLMMGNKIKFLRFIYGSDNDIPKKWIQPTEDVFKIP